MLTYNYIGGVVEDYDTAFMSNVKNISGNWTVEKLWRIFRSLQPVCIIIPAWNCVT